MLVRITFGAALAGLALVAAGAPAQARTARECSAKYKEAQTAGTLGGLKWNDFRKAQCGDGGTSEVAAVPSTSSAPNPLKPVPPTSSASIPITAGAATFPLIDWLHKRLVALLSPGDPGIRWGNTRLPRRRRGVSSARSPLLPFVSPELLLLPAASPPPPQPCIIRSGTAEQNLGTTGWQTQALWFAVLAVCAPVWEEVMFRGFLLPSLARYLPPWGAVAATSAIFATVHFSAEGLLPLLLLGCVFGGAYARTRNLLAPIALHSLWNVALLVQLLLAGGGGGAA